MQPALESKWELASGGQHDLPGRVQHVDLALEVVIMI